MLARVDELTLQPTEPDSASDSASDVAMEEGKAQAAGSGPSESRKQRRLREGGHLAWASPIAPEKRLSLNAILLVRTWLLRTTRQSTVTACRVALLTRFDLHTC